MYSQNTRLRGGQTQRYMLNDCGTEPLLGEESAPYAPVRVLIAEDEWLVALALQRKMQALGHTVVGMARDGEEALTLCAREAPDIVFMDVRMPGMDGLEATHRLMAERATCVIILTGNTLLDQHARLAGAMDYIIKPLAPSRIPAVMAAALQRFQRYLAVSEQAVGVEDALCTWLAVQDALALLCNEQAIAEEDAFAVLQQLAAERHLSLRAAAEEILAGADSPG